MSGNSLEPFQELFIDELCAKLLDKFLVITVNQLWCTDMLNVAYIPVDLPEASVPP